MRFSSIDLDGIKVCRQCYRKATGHTSRVELQWSRFIDRDFGTDFLMGNDLSMKAMGACTLQRPDKIWGSTAGLVVCGELDEHYHRGYLRECEEARMSSIAEQMGGAKVVFLRMNPHLKGPTLLQRFERYRQVLQQLIDNPPEPLVSVVYLFYPPNAHNITQRWPHTLL